MKTNYPQSVNPVWVTIHTHYDNATREDRRIFHKCYEYDNVSKLYYLINPEGLENLSDNFRENLTMKMEGRFK